MEAETKRQYDFYKPQNKAATNKQRRRQTGKDTTTAIANFNLCIRIHMNMLFLQQAHFIYEYSIHYIYVFSAAQIYI